MLTVRMLEQAKDMELTHGIIDLLDVLSLTTPNLHQLLEREFVNAIIKYVNMWICMIGAMLDVQSYGYSSVQLLSYSITTGASGSQPWYSSIMLNSNNIIAQHIASY